MPSLHDHFVRELSVDVGAKQLRLRTAYPRPDGPQFAVALFAGVEGYILIGDALGTIIFDVEEVDALTLYDEFGEDMRKTYRTSG